MSNKIIALFTVAAMHLIGFGPVLIAAHQRNSPLCYAASGWMLAMFFAFGCFTIFSHVQEKNWAKMDEWNRKQQETIIDLYEEQNLQNVR